VAVQNWKEKKEKKKKKKRSWVESIVIRLDDMENNWIWPHLLPIHGFSDFLLLLFF
jgi:hypothetical protein